jgi:hypothetical protein
VKRIEVTYSTMGQSSRASAGEGGWYVWNGDPDKSEAARATRTVRAQGITADRAKRLEEFAGYLDQGLNAAQAGRLIGIKPATARHYERDLKTLREQQRGETSDA